METVDRRARHVARCRRWDEIDWEAARPARRRAAEPAPLGPVVLEVDRLKKYYEIADSSLFAMFKRGKRADGQGQRAARLRRARGADGGDRRRVRLRQVDLRQGADGPGDRDRGRDPRSRQGHLAHLRSRSAAPDTVGHLQMVFQNPFDTLNPSHSVGWQIARVIRNSAARRTGAQVRERVCSCSTRSSCRAISPTAGRASSPAGRSSASASPAPSPAIPRGDRRRAGLGARRLGAGGGHRAADGHPARAPHDAALHQPRPLGGALPRRPRRGDVSRPDHGAGHHRRDLRAALPPLHRGAALGRADRRHPGQKKRIVLEGEMPCALNPPQGCPF